MGKGREVHCYEYVNHPYEAVRDALAQDAPGTFHAATKASSARAQTVLTYQVSPAHCAAGSSGLEFLSSRFGLVSVCGDVCRRYMYRECPRREGGRLQA